MTNSDGQIICLFSWQILLTALSGIANQHQKQNIGFRNAQIEAATSVVREPLVSRVQR